jgi:hypothetical protein
MSNLVIARYADGRTVKGTSIDVDPAKPLCHVRTAEGKVVEVQLADLKALFFVRDLKGDRLRPDAQRPDPADSRLRGAKGIQVTFKDGEKLVGVTHHFPPVKPMFFVLPVDAGSNNIRVLVNRTWVTDIAPGP